MACRGGIELLTNSRVSAIEPGRLTITSPAGDKQQIAFGACCWATGVAIHPLVKHLREQLASQTHFRWVAAAVQVPVCTSSCPLQHAGRESRQIPTRSILHTGIANLNQRAMHTSLPYAGSCSQPKLLLRL